MKIGIDARLWNETGVGRYIRNLVWQLQKLDKKNEYVLFVSKDFKRQALGFTNEKWKIVPTSVHWHTLAEQLKFPKILQQENLDLVHFPYFSVPIFYQGSYVITIHDLIIDHYPTGKATTLPSPVYQFKLLAYKYIIKQAARHAQKVIAVSQATKDEIVQHLSIPANKITVTYEGIDKKVSSIKYQVLSREKNEKNTLYMIHNTKYFLYVGNAYPHKNLDRLVDAFVLLLQEYADYKLILVGKEDYFYKRLKEKVKALHVEKQIIFAGFVPDDLLRGYYHHAIGTIVPSLMEGFGLPGLEAMQANCLVLAADIPSLREIYEDAAVYFNPLAIASIHATIRKVLEKKIESAAYKKKGKTVVASFSWEKMAKETLKIYESSVSVRSNQ